MESREHDRFKKRNYIRLAQYYMIMDTKWNKIRDEIREKLQSISGQSIIERGIDVNYQIIDEPCNKREFAGYTLLHLAVIKFDLISINLFLSKGANFTIQGQDGKTPLHKIIEGSLALQRLKKRKKICSLADTILAMHMKSRITTNPSCKDGITHLHIASMTDNAEVIEYFLNAGVNVNQVVNADSEVLPGFTSLHFAARYSSVKAAEVLLKYKADVNIRDKNGRSALHLLIERNIEINDIINTGFRKSCIPMKNDIEKNKLIIKLILENIEIRDSNFIDKYGFSILHAASVLEDKSLMENILTKNIDIHSRVNTNSPLFPGYTALHFAAHFNVEIIKLLLQNGAEINTKDAKGVTPLNMCLELHTLVDLHSILSAEKNCADIMFADSKTKLLDCLLAMNNLKNFKSFLDNLQDVNNIIPADSQFWPKYTILHLVILLVAEKKYYPYAYDDFEFEKGPFIDSDEFYNDEEKNFYLNLVELCLQYGANVTIQLPNGETPIDLAFNLTKVKIVNYLLNYYSKGRIHNKSDPKRLIYFFMSCATGSGETVKKFLENDFKVSDTIENSFSWPKQVFQSPRNLTFLFVREKSTPLHVAVMFYNQKATKVLLEHGADPNAQDAYGMTPIQFTLYLPPHPMMSMARILLSFVRNRSFTNLTTKENLSHLHVAAFAHGYDLFEGLLSFEGDVNSSISLNQDTPENLSFLSRYEGFTPLHCALMDPKKKKIELLIKHGANILAKDAAGITPLHLALDSHDVYDRNYLQLFTSTFKSDTYVKSFIDDRGLTLLHLACANCDLDLVKYLVENGADVNAKISRKISKVKELHLLSQKSFEMGTRVTYENDWTYYTPLHVVINEASKLKNKPYNFDTIIQLLLDNGADILSIDTFNSTPLHFAYESIDKYECYGIFLFDTLDMLLKSPMALMNPVNDNGLSHFHLACARNHVEIVKEFLKSNANVNEIYDGFGMKDAGFTPLHFAVRYGCEEVAIELLNHGADVKAEDCLGRTPLHVAIIKDSFSLKFFKKMLRAGADINAKTNRSETPLEILLQSQNLLVDRVKFFLTHGCKINTTNSLTNEGYIGLAFYNILYLQERKNLDESIFNFILETPDILNLDENDCNAIHNVVSVRRGYAEEMNYNDYMKIIPRLVEIGCCIDQQNKQGETPLHTSIKMNKPGAVSCLLSLGADINIVDFQENSPLAFCIKYFQSYYQSHPTSKEIVKYLLKMKSCGLKINESDAELIKTKFSNVETLCRYDEEMSTMEKIDIHPNWTLQDFLTKPELIIEYPMMPQAQKRVIDSHFTSVEKLKKQFPEYFSLLMMNFKKTKKRIRLIRESINALIVIGFQFPELCLERILYYLENIDLQFLIKSTEEFKRNLKHLTSNQINTVNNLK